MQNNILCVQTSRGKEREGGRERGGEERGGDRDRQTDRQTDRVCVCVRERETGRQADRQTDRQSIYPALSLNQALISSRIRSLRPVFLPPSAVADEEAVQLSTREPEAATAAAAAAAADST